MDNTAFESAAWVDLLLAESQAKSAQEKVTERAMLYMHGGLPLDRVLDALQISRATWYRRVADLNSAKESRLADANEHNRTHTEWKIRHVASQAKRHTEANPTHVLDDGTIPGLPFCCLTCGEHFAD